MANNHSKTKQVIIMRKDLNLSPGKLGAQASHASLSAILNKNKDDRDIHIELSDEELEWFHERFTKVILEINSEKELLELHKKAREKNLNVSRPIIDAGFTEFEQPTLTCIAIGPNYKESIDEVCGHLRTYSKSKKEQKVSKYIKKRIKKLEKESPNCDELKNLKTLL